MSTLSHLVMGNRISSFTDSDMSSLSAYSLQLPYLGTIPLGKSPPNLASFQKPLRELYIAYYRQRRDERHHDERRIIISDRDILMFEPEAVSKGKRSLIYSTLESIIDIQALELYLMFNYTENHHHKRIRAAFLPIGCEHQERFRSLYSTIDKSQYSLLSTPPPPSSCHPPLLLFVMKKTGTSATCSLLDCHTFAVRRESVAFDLCDMIRKLIIKRTTSPILPTRSPQATTTTLLHIRDNAKEPITEKRTKYLDRDRPISAMEHRQADIPTHIDKGTNRSLSYINLNDIKSNGLINPLLSSSFLINNNQHSNPCHETSQVLNIENDVRHLSSPSSTPMRTLPTKYQPLPPSQQRHFIKASSSSSSLAIDESDEVVNDLMNIVVAEKLKTIDTNSCQTPVKRHASFDQASSLNDYNDHTMNKKRYLFHNNNNNNNNNNNKKRSLFMNSNPLPTIISANNTPVISRTTTNIEQPPTSSVFDSCILHPSIVINRYGDIGNYVPKLLRENVTTTMRSSDSNENIFFRATNGHILNGFLNLDFSSTTQTTNKHCNYNNNNPQYRSASCLNADSQDRNVISFVKQPRKNQKKCNMNEKESPISNHIVHNENNNDDHRVPSCQVPRVTFQYLETKPVAAAMGGIKVLPAVSAASQRTFKSSYIPSSSSSSKAPKRVASFTIADTELPLDYRQFLRHTDQGVQLYGEEQQRQQQQQATTFEHSLGYLP